jgi:hypothetical protein
LALALMLRKPDFGMIGDLPNHVGEIPVDRGVNIHIDAEAVLRTWMSRLYRAGALRRRSGHSRQITPQVKKHGSVYRPV